MTDTDDGDFAELNDAARKAMDDYVEVRGDSTGAFYASGRPRVHRIRRDAVNTLRELADWIDRWGAL